MRKILITQQRKIAIFNKNNENKLFFQLKTSYLNKMNTYCNKIETHCNKIETHQN